MKSMYTIILVAVLLIGGVVVSTTSSKPDSPLEQGIEAILKNQTGQDIDFSAERKANEAEEKKD